MSHLFIVADDHPLFRGALREILKSLPQGGAIVEAADFEETAAALKANPEADLLLLDLTMPGMNGLSGLALLRSDNPGVPIAIVSGSEEGAIVARALDLGASGFIPKSSGFEEMRGAIEALLAGEIYVPPDADLASERDPEVTELIQRIRTLTPQQTRVLAMLSRGLLNKQIAYELGLSEATIKAHVSAVLLKLGVDSRTQAVIRLSQLGLDLDSGLAGSDMA